MNKATINKEVIACLSSSALFSELNADDMYLLAGQMEKVSLNCGDTLIRQGDPGACFYVLQSGHLEVRLKKSSGQDVVLNRIGPGDCVGEIALITGERRTASVVALTDADLFKMSSTGFTELEKHHPHTAALFTDLIVERLQRSELQKLLYLSGLFNNMSDPVLKELEKRLELIYCASGEFLMHEGDTSRCMYIVVSGRLQVISNFGTGKERVLTDLGRGQTVGEITFFTGESRSATVRATRDSFLAKLSEHGFNELLSNYAKEIMCHFAGNVITRLRQQSNQAPVKTHSIVNIALIPTSTDVPLTEFADQLKKEMSKTAQTLHLNSAILDYHLGSPGAAQISADDPSSVTITRWLNHRESEHRFVLYQADDSPSEWTKRCLRQADRILLIGQAKYTAHLGAIESTLLSKPQYQDLPRYLILIHDKWLNTYNRTHEWLALRDVKNHYHCESAVESDMKRLARLITGKGIGLVLGGGGARGFAHIGVLRAMKEFGFEIDMVGGTSIGSIVAAMIAFGWDYETILEKSIAFNYRLDYTFPIVALTSGGNFTRGLKNRFDDRKIEDLKTNFFCVSTNLGRATAKVHRAGLLWKSVRASASVPGMFPPVVDSDELLVDGGLVNNMPIDIMHSYDGIGITIGSDVSGPSEIETASGIEGYFNGWRLLSKKLNPFACGTLQGVPSLPKILLQSSLTKASEAIETTKNLADFYLRLPVQNYGLMEFDKLKQIVDTGYAHTKAEIEKWQTHEKYSELNCNNILTNNQIKDKV